MAAIARAQPAQSDMSGVDIVEMSGQSAAQEALQQAAEQSNTGASVTEIAPVVGGGGGAAAAAAAGTAQSAISNATAQMSSTLQAGSAGIAGGTGSEGGATQLSNAQVGALVQLSEQANIIETISALGLPVYSISPPSIPVIRRTLGDAYRATGNKPVMLYTRIVPGGVFSAALTHCGPPPEGEEESEPEIGCFLELDDRPGLGAVSLISTEELRQELDAFRRAVSQPRVFNSKTYLKHAQRIYELLVGPLEAQLAASEIDTLVISPGPELRSIPFAALHDGEQFLIEKYAISIIPSFGLTDVSYADARELSILAMGASEFEDQTPLPSVPNELNLVTREPWRGEVRLNQEFTVEEFRTLSQRPEFGIIHLATHGQFRAGSLESSYIQFGDRKLLYSELGQLAIELGWSTSPVAPIELLVLSACRTALGDTEAELGFAGLSVQSGVKSTLASLWYVSDRGTLALMSEFYRSLNASPLKASALRQAQLRLLRGETRIEDGQLRLENGEIVPLDEGGRDRLDFSHPYFWSSFVLVGNWN